MAATLMNQGDCRVMQGYCINNYICNYLWTTHVVM